MVQSGTQCPKFPHVKVKMVGQDGNAFAIIGRCMQVMRNYGCTKEEMKAFYDESTASDYDNLLRICMSYFDVD